MAIKNNLAGASSEGSYIAAFTKRREEKETYLGFVLVYSCRNGP